MLNSLRRIIQRVNATSDLDEALNVIVEQIQHEMEVDVCSTYLLSQSSGGIVLMATRGLNPDAVARSELGAGEGLVGQVIRTGEPPNVDDAASHPQFKPTPNSGEERYHAFLGVPIIHHRKALGVLIVRRVAAHRFKESEVAFLVTLAAQVAGAIAYAQASGAIERVGALDGTEHCIEGEPGAPGLALGTCVIHFALELRNVPDRVPEDKNKEEKALRSAIAAVVDEIGRMGTTPHPTLLGELGAFSEAYRLMLSSDAWVESILDHIRAGNWAPGALRETVEKFAHEFETMDDPVLRTRASDIRELGRRTLMALRGQRVAGPQQYPEHTILVGEEIGLFDLLAVPGDRLSGLVCGHGSAYSHVALLAHALSIPAVMGIGSIPFAQLDGRQLVVDGYGGKVHVDPGPGVRREFARLIHEEQELTANLSRLEDEPAVTPDGVEVALYVNAGLTLDRFPSAEIRADGIGLYRTELPFLVAERFPSEDEQCVNYRGLLKSFSPRPVVVRTLDVGGDKMLPYFPVKEVNPALGWRGMRVTLDHPEIFLTQLRAMVRAAEGLNNLQVLFPMISGVAELDEAIAALSQAVEQLSSEGHDVHMPPIGAMIEVPSAVFQAEALARRVDFFSLGTNDLTQYMLAVDRNNERVADLFDSLHPGVLHALRQVIDAAHRQGKSVSVCGEMASEPSGALLLLGMGVDCLSVSRGDLLRIKWVIRSFSLRQASQLAEAALRCETPESVRKLSEDMLESAGLGGLVRPGQ